MSRAFGQALLDHHRGDRTDPLLQRDGMAHRDHPIEAFYFGEFDGEWRESWLEGPLVDLGAGAGHDTLYFQDRFETVAIEASDPLVTLLEERGVDDARHADMFALSEQFAHDRFQSAMAIGTQLGLATSLEGLRAFLADLAAVTTPTATAVVDAYDATYDGVTEMLGYREDERPDTAFRTFWFEYGELVDPALLFQLFSPNRLREAARGTPWSVAEIHRPDESPYYLAALEK